MDSHITKTLTQKTQKTKKNIMNVEKSASQLLVLKIYDLQEIPMFNLSHKRVAEEYSQLFDREQQPLIWLANLGESGIWLEQYVEQCGMAGIFKAVVTPEIIVGEKCKRGK